jgi:hypothetical protein
MSKGSIVLRMTIAGILGVAIVGNSIDEQIPACIRSMPAKATAAAACPDKAQAPFHLEPKHVGTLTPTEMPFLLRNSAANFINHQYVPERRQFVQPEQAGNLIVLTPPSCPDKDRAPLHLERKDEQPVNVTIIPDPGSLVFNDYAADILMNQDDDDEDLTLYDSAPCPDKHQAPLHLERKDGRTVRGSGNLIAGASTIQGTASVTPT